MEVTVNGEALEILDDSALDDVLLMLGLDDRRGIAIAINGEVIPRSEWNDVKLEGGQRIEVLRAVQGG